MTVNGAQQEVEIVGTTRGDFVRTMYFLRGDLSVITGVNATSVYLDLPNGVEVDTELGEISVGVVERQSLIDGMETLIEQQTQLFQAIMYLGLLFTIAVMLNTMIMNVAERDFELATHMFNTSTTTSRAQKFPLAASFKINLSSVKSDTALLSCAFSFWSRLSSFN